MYPLSTCTYHWPSLVKKPLNEHVDFNEPHLPFTLVIMEPFSEHAHVK